MSTRAAVIGFGSMGKNHARVYAGLGGVEMVAAADTRWKEEMRQTYNELGVSWSMNCYGSIERMLQKEEPDVVSIAVPSVHHCEVAQTALAYGAHVLVEKPIAASLRDAQRLIDAAKDAERTLAVGHIERHNPAIVVAKQAIDSGQLGDVYRMSFRRLGPSPVRIRDVGVTVDLMTHDLDLACWISGDYCPTGLWAVQQHVKHDGFDDGSCAWVEFAGGLLCAFETDWLTEAKVRQVTISGERGVIAVDLLRQRAQLSRLGGESANLPVLLAEPLSLELSHFIRYTKGDESARIATGLQGLNALALALDILRAGDQGPTIKMRGSNK